MDVGAGSYPDGLVRMSRIIQARTRQQPAKRHKRRRMRTLMGKARAHADAHARAHTPMGACTHRRSHRCQALAHARTQTYMNARRHASPKADSRTRTHTHTRTRTRTRARARAHTCAHTHARARVHAHAESVARARAHAQRHAPLQTRMRASAYAHTHAYAPAHAHTRMRGAREHEARRCPPLTNGNRHSERAHPSASAVIINSSIATMSSSHPCQGTSYVNSSTILSRLGTRFVLSALRIRPLASCVLCCSPTAATRLERASLQYAGRLWESVQQSSHPVPTAALKTGKSSAAGSHAKRTKSSPAEANDGRVPGEQAIGAKALGANKNGANKRGVAENGVNANGHDEPPLLLPLLGPGAVELRRYALLPTLAFVHACICEKRPSRHMRVERCGFV
eukprot:1695117-Pleurochrysis_carterae.AAC.1